MRGIDSEWADRIAHWVRALREDFYTPLGEISWEAFFTTEHLDPEEAAGRGFEPVSPGFAWGRDWEYGWFHARITLPDAAEGGEVVLDLHPGGESTLFVGGQPFGTYRRDDVAMPHHFLVDNWLSECAQAGAEYDLLLETYAGHPVPENPGCCTGPVMPEREREAPDDGPRRTVGVSTYGLWNEDAYQLYLDVAALGGILETTDPASLRAARIAEGLEQFTLTVDFEQERAERISSYREASRLLRPLMEAENGSTQPVFYAVGNAHLDLAWLWPMAETERKTARTFAAQLRLLDRYPDYRYLQSQPAAYEMCRQNYPELFARIREAVSEGRWIAEGAMWVEPDTNLPGGESLIRQLMHGKRYFSEELGTESEILWLPDSFGYSAALPQILRGCGVKYLVTQKIYWSYNEGEMFPHHYFTWRGTDGSEVTAFLPTSYTYGTDPAEINRTWSGRRQVRDLDAFLLPFGYGDGGGGPCRDHVEYALRERDLEGVPRVRMAGPKEFFEDMERAGGPRHTYEGELYFSAHRATYTSQALIKKLNRRCETALREMELWGSLAMLEGWKYPLPAADALWKRLLLHQFHDILPGSSIGRVCREAEEALGLILDESGEILDEALRFLAGESGDVTVWNSLGFPRKALVALPDSFAGGAFRADGRPVPTQCTGEGVRALAELPPCGALSLHPANVEDPVSAETDPAHLSRCGDGWVMENGRVRAGIGPDGTVTSFCLKESGREFAAGPMNRFRFYKDVPRLFDAWDLDSNYRQQETEGAFDVRVEPAGEGLEAALRVTGKIGASSYSQTIRLQADSTRLEFDTEVDWRELHRLLKVDFPVDVHAQNGINEIQFGFVERPTHRSREFDRERFEVCNHRYSVLADGSHGAAVLNDCKYGISMNKNSLELTLLTASAAPEMRADNRIHRFTYAFTAWEGPFAQSDVVRQAYELNVKPPVTAGSRDLAPFSIDRENVMLDTVKPAEDGSGDVILRFYESKKADCSACVRLRELNFRAFLCDMLENTGAELPVSDGSFCLHFGDFEVKTVRIVRKTG